MKDYRWAAIGCGDIARQFAQAMRQEGRTLYGVANRTYEKAAAFAEEYSATNNTHTPFACIKVS